MVMMMEGHLQPRRLRDDVIDDISKRLGKIYNIGGSIQYTIYNIFIYIYQCVTRPKIWTRPIPRFVLVPNFFETGSDIKEKLQKFRERDETKTNTNTLKKLKLVTRLFFGTKFFRDRFRYRQNKGYLSMYIYI